MSTSRWATVFWCGLIVAITWLGSILVAEVGFRLVGDVPSFDLQGLYAPFAEGNYKYASWVKTDARLASGHLFVYTDGLGLRCDGQQRFALADSASVDVMLLGDSQGFGNGVNFEDSVAGSLAVVGAQHGCRIANASVGGHSLRSQLDLAQWLTDQRRIKVGSFVLLLTPAMIEGCDRLNRAHVGDDGRLYGGNPDLKTRSRLWAKTHLVTYSRVRDAARNSGIGVDPARESATVFDFYKGGTHENTNRERLLAAVKQFKDFASGHGAGIQLAYVPLTVEADFKPVKQAAARVNLTLDNEVPFRTCAFVAETLQLPLHDLRPAMERAHSEGAVLNVVGDFHYSAILSRACGHKLWGDIKAQLGNAGVTKNLKIN